MTSGQTIAFFAKQCTIVLGDISKVVARTVRQVGKLRDEDEGGVDNERIDIHWGKGIRGKKDTKCVLPGSAFSLGMVTGLQ